MGIKACQDPVEALRIKIFFTFTNSKNLTIQFYLLNYITILSYNILYYILYIFFSLFMVERQQTCLSYQSNLLSLIQHSVQNSSEMLTLSSCLKQSTNLFINLN